MTILRITNPSPEYERWRGQPCERVGAWPGDGFSPDGYFDVRLIGDLDRGLRLRIKASAVRERRSAA